MPNWRVRNGRKVRVLPMSPPSPSEAICSLVHTPTSRGDHLQGQKRRDGSRNLPFGGGGQKLEEPHTLFYSLEWKKLFQIGTGRGEVLVTLSSGLSVCWVLGLLLRLQKMGTWEDMGDRKRWRQTVAKQGAGCISTFIGCCSDWAGR